MTHGCFITGTDTEIGKTTIAAAIVSLLGKTGLRVAGLKPVAAGMSVINGERINEDVHALRSASNVTLRVDEVAPFQFEAACAPHVAAALEGRSIDRGRILAAIEAADRKSVV